MHLFGFLALLGSLSGLNGMPSHLSPESTERREIRGICARLLEAADSAILVLANAERDRMLLRAIAEADMDSEPALGLPLLRAMENLIGKSSPQKPLKVISLYRPLRAGRPNEPHGNGQAVDIAAFGGFDIRSENPSDCEEAVLAMIAALGDGAYRLGLPMPPHSEPIPFLPTPDRRPDWPFFPPPLAQLHDELDIVMPRLLDDGRIPPTRLSPVILCWANARYAPRQDLQSARIKQAIESAALRGVNIHSLFPDGTNHLHLDTKPAP